MKIRWHKRAVAQLYEVENNVLWKFGEQARQEFMDEVEQSVLKLSDMPMMGALGPLFAHRKRAYRSIIVRKLNKVVYYVDGGAVHIAAFWDCRREPRNQAAQVK